MSAEKVIALAKSQVGIGEYPEGSGITKYGVDFGERKSKWDVPFLWWIYHNAGEGFAFFGGAKPTRRDALLRWYSEMGWTAEIANAQPGDILVIKNTDISEELRYGLVVKILGTARYQTVEGDLPDGTVGYRERYPYEIAAVLCPQYAHTIDEETIDETEMTEDESD